MRLKRVAIGVCLILLPVTVAAGEDHPKPQINPSGFTSARVCGTCHVDIYKGWKGSMHANAMSDPIFYPIFLEASRETDGKSDPLCLSCHAPTVRLTRDLKLKDPLTAEGVTCDFCHSIKKVTVGARDPIEIELGRVKRGPLKEVSSPFHGTEYSELFEQSRLCGGCHEYRNARGVPVLETFSEWSQGPYPNEGKQCQSCHMPPVDRPVVPPEVKPTQEIYINSHEAAGGHFAEQVRKAVILKIGEVVRDGEKIHAVVSLENVGSGHKVPTGLPTRKLVLSFQALFGGTPLYSTERIFQKTLVDAKGAVLVKDADLFLKAVRVSEDNRLEPRKVRTEHFEFYAPEGKKVEMRTALYYLYQPRIIQETEMKVKLGEEAVTFQNK